MYFPAGSRSICYGAFGVIECVIRTWTMTYVSNRILEILRKRFNSVARALNLLATGDIVLVHPAGRALTSDLSVNSCIINALYRKLRPNFKKILLDNHYITIHGPVRSE